MVIIESKLQFLNKHIGGLYSFDEACKLEQFLYENFPTDSNPINWTNIETGQRSIIGINPISKNFKKILTKKEKQKFIDVKTSIQSKEAIKKMMRR